MNDVQTLEDKAAVSLLNEAEILTVKNMMQRWYEGREPDGLDQETIPVLVLRIIAALREQQAELDALITKNQEVDNE